jgi:hypothetical protein
MVKRTVNWRLYLAALVIASLIFFAAIATDRFLTDKKNDILLDAMKSLVEDNKNAQLELLLIDAIGEGGCSILQSEIENLADKSEELRTNVADYEASGRIFTGDFVVMKSQYTTVLIENWIFLRQFEKKCDYNGTTIVFFYSNLHCARCSDQGTVLTYAGKVYNRTSIFALDSDLDLNILKMMKKLYNVTDVFEPVIIINEKRYDGFRSVSDISGILS